jgi:hypothetical protein
MSTSSATALPITLTLAAVVAKAIAIPIKIFAALGMIASIHRRLQVTDTAALTM